MFPAQVPAQVSVGFSTVQTSLPEGVDTSLPCSIEDIPKNIVQACRSKEDLSLRMERCSRLLKNMIEKLDREEGIVEWKFSSPPSAESWKDMLHDLLALLEEGKEKTLSSGKIDLLNKTCLCIICGLPLHTPVDLSRIAELAVCATEGGGLPTFSDPICKLLKLLIAFGLDPLKGGNERWSWHVIRSGEETFGDSLLNWIRCVLDQRSAADQEGHMQFCLDIVHGLVKPKLVNREQSLGWLCEQLKRCLWSSSEASSSPLSFDDLLEPQTWKQDPVIPSQLLGFFPHDARRIGTLMRLLGVVQSMYKVYTPVELGTEVEWLTALNVLLVHNLALYDKRKEGTEVLRQARECFEKAMCAEEAAQQENIPSDE